MSEEDARGARDVEAGGGGDGGVGLRGGIGGELMDGGREFSRVKIRLGVSVEVYLAFSFSFSRHKYIEAGSSNLHSTE